MVQVNQSSRSVMAIARAGNFQAIAYWLNTFLQPQNLFARVRLGRSGRLQVFVEFYPLPGVAAQSPQFRASVVKLICHRLWQLNSEVLEGVQVMARYIGQRKILWRQSVRVVSPARKIKLGRVQRSPAPPSALTQLPPPAPISSSPGAQISAQQLRHQIRQTAQQRAQFKALRSFFLTGSTAAAFIVGCWLGYGDAPPEQTSASAHLEVSQSQRTNVLQTPIGALTVVQQPVANPQDPTATLMFGGDVALTDTYAEQIGKDYQWSFAQLNDYRQADVAMVNLESPFTRTLTPTEGKKDPLKADPNLVEVLKSGGVDLVNLANSGTMDYAAPGLEETLTTLQQAGIYAIGAGKNAATARLPKIIDVKGQRIAYMGYDYFGAKGASEQAAGTNLSRQEQVAADIKAVRDQVDWVVVNYHWGDEVTKYPGDAEVGLARFTIDQGADLVVGYHAQVLQGAELYKGRPIIYSLGNFVFGNQTTSDYDTAVLKVALNDKQMKVELLPVEVRKYQPRIVAADRGTQILKQIETVSDIFQQPLPAAVVLDTRPNAPTIVSPAPRPALIAPPASPQPSAAPSLSPSEPSAQPPADQQPKVPWSNDSFITQPPVKHSAQPIAPTAAPSPPDEPSGENDRAPVSSDLSQPNPVTAGAETGEQGNHAGGGLVSELANSPLPAVIAAPAIAAPDNLQLTEPPIAVPSSPPAPTAMPENPPLDPAIAPVEPLHPRQSLESIKRRYAQAESPDLGQIADAILLPSE